MQEAIRPLWLWSVASIASQVHLPFLYTWETEHQCWFPEHRLAVTQVPLPKASRHRLAVTQVPLPKVSRRRLAVTQVPLPKVPRHRFAVTQVPLPKVPRRRLPTALVIPLKVLRNRGLAQVLPLLQSSLSPRNNHPPS